MQLLKHASRIKTLQSRIEDLKGDKQALQKDTEDLKSDKQAHESLLAGLSR